MGGEMNQQEMAKPHIVVSKPDHERLTQLANGLLDRKPEGPQERLL